jgi:hypothetical protein
MPLVDGKASTRLIRAYEKEHSPPVSKKCQSYGRIPIIAVSASLSEQARVDYLKGGFDGWILKPINFTRLEAIIAAIQDENTRKALVYPTSKWEEGGWFKFSVERFEGLQKIIPESVTSKMPGSFPENDEPESGTVTPRIEKPAFLDLGNISSPVAKPEIETRVFEKHESGMLQIGRPAPSLIPEIEKPKPPPPERESAQPGSLETEKLECEKSENGPNPLN